MCHIVTTAEELGINPDGYPGFYVVREGESELIAGYEDREAAQDFADFLNRLAA